MCCAQIVTNYINTESSKIHYHYYRGKQTGHSAQGWKGALSLFSLNNQSAPDPMQHIQWIKNIQPTLIQRVPPPPHLGNNIIQLATTILQWGGVTRGNLGKLNNNPNILYDIIITARTRKVKNNAPMNSGWTKIAAFFAISQGTPNVIWDSRVSCALCNGIMRECNLLGITSNRAHLLFPYIGYIAGRGGTRPRLLPVLRRFWPNGYGKWDFHFSGASLVDNIVQQLNTMPHEAPCTLHTISGQAKWSRWEVAMALFVMGY